MIGSKVTIDKSKKVFSKISKIYSDKNERVGANKESSTKTFQATAYVPKFWQSLFNISRLMLFLVIIMLIFWFTIGNDLYFSFQRNLFENENISAFYGSNMQDFQKVYEFSLQRNQKLSGLSIDKESDAVQLLIEDENMPKYPRPAMVFQLSSERWKSEDYERIEDGKLVYHRNKREKTIEKNWVYELVTDTDGTVQSDVLTYLGANQQELSDVKSSVKNIGLDFEIYPDSIISEMKFQKFGNYKLMYSQVAIDREKWNKIDQYVYIKHIPRKWEED